MSTRTSAKAIGNNDARSAEYAVGIRKDWLKATNNPEKQAEIAADFKIGYIAGRERISLSDALAIFEAGKGAGVPKKHVAMIDRAVSGFNYHIRNGKTKPSAEPKSFRVQRDLRDAAQAYLQHFDSVADAIKVLRAVAK